MRVRVRGGMRPAAVLMRAARDDGRQMCIRQRARVGHRPGRGRPAGLASFPAQAQVVGPGARVERRFGQMGRAEIVLGRKMSDGPNLIGFFSWKIMIWVLGCIVLGLKYL